MAKIDWIKAQTHYIRFPTASIKDIAEKFGVSDAIVFKRAKDENWKQLKKDHQKKVAEMLSATAVEKDAKAIEETTDRHLLMVRLLREKNFSTVVNYPDYFIQYAEAQSGMMKSISLEREILGLSSPAGGVTQNNQFNIFNIADRDKTQTLNLKLKEFVLNGGTISRNKSVAGT